MASSLVTPDRLTANDKQLMPDASAMVESMNRPCAMESELQAHIKTAIRPYRAGPSVRPPFSTEQLVVMALVLHEKPMAAHEITTWIFKTFSYFNSMAINELFYCGPSKPEHDTFYRHEAVTFKRDLENTFGLYELPAVCIGEEEDGVLRWEASQAAARTLLVSARSRHGVFPFFRLPPELRSKVYEMVFYYPSGGLSLRRIGCPGERRDWTQFFTYTKIAISDVFTAQKNIGGYRRLNTPPTFQILQPLLVNRQFLHEAGHLFYSMNTFYFENLLQLHSDLLRLHHLRRNNIGHIAFTYCWSDKSMAAMAFKLLLPIKHLRKLTIYIDEARVASGTYNTRSEEYNALRITGIPTLRKLRGLESVEMFGDCPQLSECLKKELTQPKIEGNKHGSKSKTRKRKPSSHDWTEATNGARKVSKKSKPVENS